MNLNNWKDQEFLKKVAKKIIESRNVDERFWKPTFQQNKALAYIRFIPDKNDEVFITYYIHAFKHKGRMFWNVCPYSFNENCPLCDLVYEFYNSTDPMKVEIAKERKRIKKYISNIYVVKDVGNPSNNGKVFLFNYGEKIYSILKSEIEKFFDQINQKGGEEIEDDIDTGCIPFNPTDGAIFKLEIIKDEFYDYTPSSFIKKRTPLASREDVIQKIIEQTYPLCEISEELKQEALKIEEKLAAYGILEEMKGKTVSVNKEIPKSEEKKIDSEADIDMEEDIEDVESEIENLDDLEEIELEDMEEIE